jgi:hypothetical protein
MKKTLSGVDELIVDKGGCLRKTSLTAEGAEDGWTSLDQPMDQVDARYRDGEGNK